MRIDQTRGVVPWVVLAMLAGLAMLAACDATGHPDMLLTEDGEAAEDDAGNDAGEPELDPPTWGEPRPLVTAEAWVPGAAENDPLGRERPATVDCPAAAWGPEAGGLEIETGACNYFFATQPSAAAIEAGDAIDVVVFHQELDAAEPAEGHVAILVGDAVVWQAHVEIPAEANVLEARVVAERAWPAGAAVGVHLHNHGYNSWTVLDVSVAPRRWP